MPETAEKPAMPDTLSVEAYVAEVLATLTPLPAVDTPLFAAHGLVRWTSLDVLLPGPGPTGIIPRWGYDHDRA